MRKAPSPGVKNPNDWEGEVRAVVDDEFLVFRMPSSKYPGEFNYIMEHRYFWDSGVIDHGKLPPIKPR